MNRYKLTFTCEAVTFRDDFNDWENLSTLNSSLFCHLESLGEAKRFLIGQERVTITKILDGNTNETP